MSFIRDKDGKVTRLQCDHIGSKGYVYCEADEVNRRGYEHTRRLTAAELATLLKGEPLKSY